MKFLWLDNSLAFCLNQQVGRKTIALTDFYFWPQTDAWGDISLYLENSKFISEFERVYLLNQISEVINAWQTKDNNNGKSLEEFIKKFSSSSFLTVD
ncbi:MAG: 30S ribosomal protein PSRP-3 [Gammaproteobacteria bacterium]